MTQVPRLRLVLAFLAIYLIWGSTYLAIRFAIETIPPFLMAGSRFLLAGVALYAIVRPRCPAPTAGNWRAAILIGGLLLLGGNGAVCWAETRVPSGLVALMIGAMPLWIALLGWALPGGSRPTARTSLAIGLGLVGVTLIVGPEQFAGGRRIDPFGALAILVSTLCWASGSLLSRRVNLPASPFLATAMEMLAGGALLTLAGLALGEHRGFDPAAVSLRSLLAVVYLLIFGSLIAFTAYVWLLQVTSPVKVATYAYVNPVVAVFLGWALADEPLSLRTALAAAAILSAVVVITRAAGGATAPTATARAAVARIPAGKEP